ncbi:MAG: TVP38/TMEM64 family protein [gamma proteobacterium endosymbiont of Lamellibrachia anaximandri]|nr:TVP38/TMEM64 family protein [gamma proteobacterium endosymbiont of Lamellibrachia anaximandri]MBL3534726.1 TVP38/TMEM64 family protein [gamma proteobacterium endosymbiont of Lamellibrachia anaximandri]
MVAIIMDVDRLRAWVSAQGYWGPVMLIGLMAIAIIVNPIPSAPIALAAGAAFGHTWGTVYVVAGAAAGAMGAFWIARLLGYELMVRFFGNRLRLGWLGSQNFLMGMVLVSRLIPFLSFDLVSYGAGLTSIKTWRFAFATLAGLIPMSFLLAHFGGELTTSSLEQALDTVLILGGLTLVPLIVTMLVKWHRRRETDRINLPDKSTANR